MRLLSASLLVFALAACGQAETPAPAAPAAEAQTTTAPVTPASAAPAATTEAACRQAVEIQYGQSGDAVTWNAGDTSVSWRAPVDGGRLTFTCAVQGSNVTLSREGQTVTVPLTNPAAAPAQEEAR